MRETATTALSSREDDVVTGVRGNSGNAKHNAIMDKTINEYKNEKKVFCIGYLR